MVFPNVSTHSQLKHCPRVFDQDTLQWDLNVARALTCREEFYPRINMLCPGRSCSLGLAGAWDKLSSHSISNVGPWGLLTPGSLVPVGHPAHK